jgi:hypothetical protein
MMNEERYYRLTGAQRGLFDSIRNACWSNDSVPVDPEELGLAVRLPTHAVEANVKALLDSKLVARVTGTPDRLHVPELTDQMHTFLEKRKQNAANAAKGGRTTQQRNRDVRSSNRSSERSTDRSSSLNCNGVDCDDVKGSALKGVSREASITTVDELPIAIDHADDHDDFRREYDNEEARMATNMESGRPSRTRTETAH